MHSRVGRHARAGPGGRLRGRPGGPRRGGHQPGHGGEPFKTVQRAADVAKPGDTVYVMAGKYDERVKVKTGGAEGKPIAFVAMPRRSAIVGGFDLEASYVRVEGFEITADKPATAVQLRASHCEVLDNYIHDMMVGGQRDGRQAERRRQHARLLGGGAQPRSPTTRSITANTASSWAGRTGWWRTTRSTASSCTPRATRYDDCDYSRFFGKGCVERCNYYHGSLQRGDQDRPRGLPPDVLQQRRDRAGPAVREQRLFRLPPDVHGGERAAHRQRAGLDLPAQHRLAQFADDARGLGAGHHPDARCDDREQHHLDGELVPPSACGARNPPTGRSATTSSATPSGPWSTATATSRPPSR